MITQKRLHELFSYNPETGNFSRLKRMGYWGRVGSIAGTIDSWGYVVIKIDQKSYKAHRLAWLYVYGVWPENHIDHIDGNISNNRIVNLRDVDVATNSQNQRKAHKNSASGFLGAYKTKNGKFLSVINVRGKSMYLGTFSDPLAAHNAYLTAKRKYHDGCTI